MLNKLKKLKEIVPVSSDGVIISLLDELIELEQERIRKQLAKDNKCLNGYNACMKVLKSKSSKNRPVLQKAKRFENGSVVFTDTIQLYWLNDNRYNLPTHDDNVPYPNVEPLIPRFGEAVKLPPLLEVKFAIKNKSYIEVGGCTVDPSLLLNAYSILGEKLSCCYVGPNKPFTLKNDKKEIGVLMPIRKVDNNA